MALQFLEARLDTRITEGAQSSIYVPGRLKLYAPTGTMKQNMLASFQILRFDVTPGIRSDAQFHQVQDAFYVVLLNQYEGLRYKHWPDYVATLNNSRATLIEGSTTVLQLQRKHSFGSIDYLRPIQKPVSPTVVVYRTRAAVTSAIAATIDYTTGRATISGHAGGDVYSWTGEFDIPVTFSDDEWTAEVIGSVNNQFMVSGSIKLEEIRLEVD